MRKIILATGEIYHIFNRSIERKPIFTNHSELSRAFLTLDYYRFHHPQPRLSHLLNLPNEIRESTMQRLHNGKKRIDVLSYCFMPNHFHFLLRQNEDNGITRCVADFTNSYTRYFNTKHPGRVGPIFQGTFSAVRIEDDEQLLHVSRYIHINPVASFLVSRQHMFSYPWSSLPEFMSGKVNGICTKGEIINHFTSLKKYKQFLEDQVDYSRTLESIKHLLLEEV